MILQGGTGLVHRLEKVSAANPEELERWKQWCGQTKNSASRSFRFDDTLLYW